MIHFIDYKKDEGSYNKRRLIYSSTRCPHQYNLDTEHK